MATEYERKRLENIRRNDEMLAALNVKTKASLLSAAAATKRPLDESKSFKKKTKKKPNKPETPIVTRKSLRTRGLNPDSTGLPDDFSDNPKRMAYPQNASSPSPRNLSARVLAPLSFVKSYYGDGSYKPFVDTFVDCYGDNVKKEAFDSDLPVKPEKIEFEGGFDVGSLSLEQCNVARVVPGRIFVVKFLPCKDVKLVAAGDKLGNVGFWNLDCGSEGDDGIYLFHPHSSPVSSIVFQQNSFSKVISSSYDGLIRLMDVEKTVFDLVYSSDEAIFSFSQRPNDEQSLYFGEGYGMFNVYDLRAGKSLFNWELHENRINSIDFNPRNPHVMATSSTDGTACLWDLRSMGANKPKTLRTVNHSRAVHSAYFSPSGLSLATTSIDNHIGILSGANFEDNSMIYHDNTTNRWISSFRGVWGWDDSYIYVGNRSNKGIDVISTKAKRTVMELHNPLMKAIPCRIHCHPLNVGMLAGSTAGGQVYVWTTK
ncbi:unnamed protein product [Cochlearia groenlandica]